MKNKTERKLLVGYESYYECDSDGNIFSLRKYKDNNKTEPLRVSYEIGRGGTYFIRLHKDNKRIRKTVGSMICLTFHGEPQASTYVAHYLNGDKSDHRAENLKWVPKGLVTKENYTKFIDLDVRRKKMQDPLNNKHTKLTAEIAKEIYRIMSQPDHPSYSEMAKEYNVTPGHIANIKAGRAWKDIADKL